MHTPIHVLHQKKQISGTEKIKNKKWKNKESTAHQLQFTLTITSALHDFFPSNQRHVKDRLA